MTFPNLDPSAPAVLFPGQGSQTPEMRDRVRRRCPELLERCLELVGEDPFLRVDESPRASRSPRSSARAGAGWTALARRAHGRAPGTRSASSPRWPPPAR